MLIYIYVYIYVYIYIYIYIYIYVYKYIQGAHAILKIDLGPFRPRFKKFKDGSGY